MRLSPYAKTPVSSIGFWISVAFVVVLLDSTGWLQMQTGHIPDIPAWLWVGPLLVFWVVTLFQLIRSRGQGFSWQQIVLAIGFTLMVLSYLLPHFSAVKSWLSGVGTLVVLVFVFLPYLEFGKRTHETSDESHSDSQV